MKSAREDSKKPSKKPGWWSRRHETDEANKAATEAWKNRASLRPKQIWDAENKVWVKVPR